MSASAKNLLVVMGSLALLAGILPAASALDAPGPPDESPVTVSPSLQVSPEVSEVRPGMPVQLTARISHVVHTEVPVHWEIRFVDLRSHFGPKLIQPLDLECVIQPARLSCPVTLKSQKTSVAVVRAWLTGPGAGPPDRQEGRLASLRPYPAPEADCRLEDGEPIDDSCRGGLNSFVEPGESHEPDATDVVLVGWTGVADAFLDCDDPDGDTEVEVRPPSQRTVTYICEAHNRLTGEPIVGAHISGEIMGGPFDEDRNGPAHADYGDYDDPARRLCATTAPAGRCSFDFTVPGSGPGQVVLCLWSDSDNNGFYGDAESDGGDCSREAVHEPENTDGTDAVTIELEEPSG